MICLILLWLGLVTLILIAVIISVAVLSRRKNTKPEVVPYKDYKEPVDNQSAVVFPDWMGQLKEDTFKDYSIETVSSEPSEPSDEGFRSSSDNPHIYFASRDGNRHSSSYS